MKKLGILILLIVFFTGISFHANAQAPYKHGIGVTAGTTQAVSYKTFIGNHFTIQLDAVPNIVMSMDPIFGRRSSLRILCTKDGSPATCTGSWV